MSDPRITRFEPMGPEGSDLEVWDEISQDDLISGTPVQRGHLYYHDEETSLMAGVWDCTPMTAKFGPYPDNEFMHVLEGSITIVHGDGSELTVNAGENFVIPKGTPCTWKQTEYVRKFFVIFTDPSGATAENPEALKAFKIEPDEDLPSADAGAPEDFVGAVPDVSAHNWYEDPTGQFISGVWESTAFERPVAPIGRCELMLPVKGSMTLLGDGEETTFKTGEAAFVPVGAPYGWRSSETVRKLYCIFVKKEAAAGAVEAAE